jgi:hypothetical protein
MGLDVSLQRYHKPVDEVIAHERAIEDAREAVWDGAGEYKGLSDGKKEKLRVAAEAVEDSYVLEHGLRKYTVGDPDVYTYKVLEHERIELDSVLYPEHLFKIGYLRSSYNSGGINYIVGDRLGKDLGWVFEAEDEEYIVRPDWHTSLVRARELLAEWRSYLRDNGSYGVVRESVNMFDGGKDAPKSSEEALECFNKEREKRRLDPTFDAYSSAGGVFYMGDEPLKVRAIMVSPTGTFNMPTTYVIYENDEGMEWYTQALEITVEMCEWVMQQKDRDRLVLHWSG